MTEQTVDDFIKQSDLIKAQVNSSVKLVEELTKELKNTREVFEHLKVFSPNDVFKSVQPYHLRKDNSSESERYESMLNIILKQINRINLLLGDKR